MLLEKLVNMNKISEVESFINERGYSFEEKENSNWKPLGGNEHNTGVISQLTEGEKGIIERLTNVFVN